MQLRLSPLTHADRCTLSEHLALLEVVPVSRRAAKVQTTAQRSREVRRSYCTHMYGLLDLHARRGLGFTDGVRHKAAAPYSNDEDILTKRRRE